MKTKKRRRPRYSLGDPCHTCGSPLNKTAGMSKSYVTCENHHLATRRQLCHLDACPKIARQTGWDSQKGTWAACDEHVYEVSGCWY